MNKGVKYIESKINTMKRYIIVATGLLALLFTACSQESITHQADNLPAKARDIISANFTSAVSLVEEEKDFGKTTEYEVTLTDGSELKFNSSGEWISIDTPNNRSVPSGLIPTAIAKYVVSKHAGASIVGIEKEKKGYEIELSNGVEISFDKGGNFLKYDK